MRWLGLVAHVHTVRLTRQSFTQFLTDLNARFRERFLAKAGKNCQGRMLKRCAAYVDAFVKEASLRDDHEVLDEENYMRLRRHNSAVQIVFVLYEYVHGIDLPDEVFEDGVFMRLYYAALDLFILTNVSRSHFTSSKSI